MGYHQPKHQSYYPFAVLAPLPLGLVEISLRGLLRLRLPCLLLVVCLLIKACRRLCLLCLKSSLLRRLL